MQQLALDIGLTPQNTFAHFLPASNGQALAHLQDAATALAQGDANAASVPVYLWGQRGTGKTHLLEATAHALDQAQLPFGWLAAGRAIDASGAPDFDASWRAILLDDVHHYSASLQQSAFNWFINCSLPQDGQTRWIVAVGGMPPVDLPLREDLRTRLASGLSFELRGMSDAQHQQVLQRQAQERGLTLSDEAAQYLLVRFARDLSSLNKLLVRLDQHALNTQRRLTIPLLREVLQQQAGSQAPE